MVCRPRVQSVTIMQRKSVNIVVVGACGSGKSSLVQCFVNDAACTPQAPPPSIVPPRSKVIIWEASVFNFLLCATFSAAFSDHVLFQINRGAPTPSPYASSTLALPPPQPQCLPSAHLQTCLLSASTSVPGFAREITIKSASLDALMRLQWRQQRRRVADGELEIKVSATQLTTITTTPTASTTTDNVELAEC